MDASIERKRWGRGQSDLHKNGILLGMLKMSNVGSGYKREPLSCYLPKMIFVFRQDHIDLHQQQLKPFWQRDGITRHVSRDCLNSL